jgi:hypothetical protein
MQTAIGGIRRDWITPDERHTTHELLPDWDLRVFVEKGLASGIGHALPMEHPDRLLHTGVRAVGRASAPSRIDIRLCVLSA